MYDVAPPSKNYGDGSAYEPAAIDAVGAMQALRSERGGGGSEDPSGRVRADSYPTALFLAPDGERLGDGLWGIMPPERLLRGLRDVIEKWPRYFEPTPDERAVLARADALPDDSTAQLDAARLAWELAEFEAVVSRADRGLGKAPLPIRAELRYLKARALTCLGRDDEARTALLAIDETAANLMLAVQVALARLELRAGKPDEAAKRLRPFCTFTTPMQHSG